MSFVCDYCVFFFKGTPPPCTYTDCHPLSLHVSLLFSLDWSSSLGYICRLQWSRGSSMLRVSSIDARGIMSGLIKALAGTAPPHPHGPWPRRIVDADTWRSEEQKSELQSLMRNYDAVFFLKKKTTTKHLTNKYQP